MHIARRTIKVLFIAIIVVIVTAAGFLSYRYFFFSSTNPLGCIPETANAVIVIKKPGEFLSKLQSGNRVWNGLTALTSTGSFRDELNRLDSLSRNAGTGDLLDENPLYIVFDGEPPESLKPALLLQFRERTSRENWESFISLAFPHQKKKRGFSLGGAFIESFPGPGGDTCFYAIHSGVFILGCEKVTVDRIVNQIGKPGSVGDDAGFVKLLETAGKMVDANVFFRFGFIKTLLERVADEMPGNSAGIIEHFGSWSATDLLLKDDELLLTGYTLPDDQNTYLGTFSGQSAIELEVFNALPFNTGSIFWIGSNDLEQYQKNYAAFDSFLKDKNGENARGKLDFPIGKVVSGEAALVKTWETSGKPASAYRLLRDDKNGIVAAYLKKPNVSGQQETYRGYAIYRTADGAGLVKSPSEGLFSISSQYFVKMGDYFVFSNSLPGLRDYIGTVDNGKTLDVSENFKSFSDNIAKNGNIFFYFNLRKGTGTLSELAAGDLKADILNRSDKLGNLQGMSFQFNKLNGYFFTNIYLRHNDGYREEDLSLWKVRLDNPIARQPFLVFDHRSDKLKVVAFDEANNIYLIDHNGNLIWKLQLAEKPISEVYQVDFYKNGKIQYLFNSENYIYLIDLLGRPVDNFPIRLNKKATAGMAVFDYDNKKDYRILIPTEDKVIYNYELSGEQVEGWYNPKMSDIVATPPVHIPHGRKDYILAADISGKIRILDRQGNTRIKLKDPVTKAGNSPIYLNKTNNKGIFITTNEKGHLIYIKPNGDTDRTVFRDFSPEHYFLYKDFDRDGSNDFIFIDGNKLLIFNRFKKVVFDYVFEEEIKTPPVVFTGSRGEKILGVVLSGTGRLFLFNGTGDIRTSSGLIGGTPFTAGSLKQDNDLNLIVGSGEIIYNYLVE